MDEDTRERLHAVLAHLLAKEARGFWHGWGPAEREGHVYAKALCLMRHFGFHDLLQEDAAVRGLYDRTDEVA